MMRNALFRLIARRFPTHRMGEDRVLAAVWRVMFYLLRPSEPFPMRTKHYTLLAYPGRDTLTRAVIRRGYWEPQQTEVFIGFLEPGAFVIDAGANFGHFALTASAIVGPTGLVVAFEPHPETYRMLAGNAALQPHANIITEAAALGAEKALLTLYTDSANPGGHSFLPAQVRRPGTPVTVPVVTIDSYIADNGIDRRLGLVKIDVERFEDKVVEGGRQTILRDRPVVICEITCAAPPWSGASHRSVLRFFGDNGFRAGTILADGSGVRETDMDALARLLEAGDRAYVDVVFVPE